MSEDMHDDQCWRRHHDCAVALLDAQQQERKGTDHRIGWNDDGTVDEVVIGPGGWLHVEEMDRDRNGKRFWYVDVGGLNMYVSVSKTGRKVAVRVFEDARQDFPGRMVFVDQ